MGFRKAVSAGAFPFIALVAMDLVSYLFIAADRVVLPFFFFIEMSVRAYAGYIPATKGGRLIDSVFIAGAVSFAAVIANDLIGAALMLAGVGPFAKDFASAADPSRFMMDFIAGALSVALGMGLIGAVCGSIGALFWRYQDLEKK